MWITSQFNKSPLFRNAFPRKLTQPTVFNDCDGKTRRRKSAALSKLCTRVTRKVCNKFFFIMKRWAVSFSFWSTCWQEGLSLGHVPILKESLNSPSKLLNSPYDYFWNRYLSGERRISEVAASKLEFIKLYGSYKAYHIMKLKCF